MTALCYKIGGMIRLVSTHGLRPRFAVRIGATSLICMIEIRATSHGWQARHGFGNAIIPIVVWVLAMIVIAAGLR